MKINNNKGFSLVELLVALLVMALMSTLITSLLMFGMNTFSVYSIFTGEQDRIVDSLQKLGKDIEKSSEITIYTKNDFTEYTDFIKIGFPDGTEKVWKFGGDKLQIGAITAVATQPAIFLDSVSNLSSAACKFKYDSSDKKLSVYLQPDAVNKGRFEGKNIKKPTITDYSVKYKTIEIKNYEAALTY